MNRIGYLAGATMLAGLAGAFQAQAADIPSRAAVAPAPAIVAFNPWMVRVRGLYVVPSDNSKVFAGGALVPGGGTNISNTFVPELDITYFFTPNIAAELILGVTPHKATATGALAALGKLGSVTLLPPTLTLQYHFTNFGAFKPYVGAGVNYTVFFGEKDAALSNFKVTNRPGLALQAGVDIMFDRHWGLNFDVKKLYLRPEATGLLGLTPVKAKLDLDPWIFGAGVTYKF